MPDSKFTTWVHGASMQLEYPNRVTAVRHTGPFVRIEGAEGQNTWVHFPIPTPTVNNGNKMQANAVNEAVAYGLVHYRLVHNNIVNASKKVLPGLGHIPQIEDPETFVDALLEFLKPGAD